MISRRQLRLVGLSVCSAVICLDTGGLLFISLFIVVDLLYNFCCTTNPQQVEVMEFELYFNLQTHLAEEN